MHDDIDRLVNKGQDAGWLAQPSEVSNAAQCSAQIAGQSCSEHVVVPSPPGTAYCLVISSGSIWWDLFETADLIPQRRASCSYY